MVREGQLLRLNSCMIMKRLTGLRSGICSAISWICLLDLIFSKIFTALSAVAQGRLHLNVYGTFALTHLACVKLWCRVTDEIDRRSMSWQSKMTFFSFLKRACVQGLSKQTSMEYPMDSKIGVPSVALHWVLQCSRHFMSGGFVSTVF